MAKGMTFVVGVAGGVIVGAAVALLYAPTTGVEARRTIRRSTARLSRRAQRLYRDASDAAADLAAGGAELLDQVKDTAARVAAAARA